MTKGIMTALALAGVIAFAPYATAATTITSSKSNGSSYKACVDGGGKVSKDAKGKDTCTPKKK